MYIRGFPRLLLFFGSSFSTHYCQAPLVQFFKLSRIFAEIEPQFPDKVLISIYFILPSCLPWSNYSSTSSTHIASIFYLVFSHVQTCNKLSSSTVQNLHFTSFNSLFPALSTFPQLNMANCSYLYILFRCLISTLLFLLCFLFPYFVYSRNISWFLPNPLVCIDPFSGNYLEFFEPVNNRV